MIAWAAIPVATVILGSLLLKAAAWTWFLSLLLAILGALLGSLLHGASEASLAVVAGAILLPNTLAASAALGSHGAAEGASGLIKRRGLGYAGLALLCLTIGIVLWSWLFPRISPLASETVPWIRLFLALAGLLLTAILLSRFHLGIKLLLAALLSIALMHLWNPGLALAAAGAAWARLLLLGGCVFLLFAGVHWLRPSFRGTSRIAGVLFLLCGLILLLFLGIAKDSPLGLSLSPETSGSSPEGSLWSLAILLPLALALFSRTALIGAFVSSGMVILFLLTNRAGASASFSVDLAPLLAAMPELKPSFSGQHLTSFLGAATLFNLSRTFHALAVGGKAARKRLPTPAMFLSYRRDDSSDVVGRIRDRLGQSFDERKIFMDVDSIPLGVDFRDHIRQEIEKCQVVLAVVGKDWTTLRNEESNRRRLDDPGDFVRVEIETALEQSIPVIPLLVRGAPMPTEEELPPSIQKFAYLNGIPVRRDPDFGHDMDRLSDALVEIRTGRKSR